MAGNTNPIYSAVPNFGFVAGVTGGNTAMDGTGVVNTVFTAGANGSFVQKVRFRPLGTNSANVGRVFINNGANGATGSNNTLFDEVTLAATTGVNNAALALSEVTMNLALPAGYKVLATLGTGATAGYSISAAGGDY